MPSTSITEADSAYQAGRYKKAERLYRSVIEQEPDNAIAREGLARCLMRLHQPDAAEMEARIALELGPDLPISHLVVGVVVTQRGQCQEGEKWIRKALQLDPGLVETYISLGSNLIGQNQIQDAIATLQEAIRLGPDRPLAYYNLGIAYAHQKNWGAALGKSYAAFKMQPSAEFMGVVLLSAYAKYQGMLIAISLLLSVASFASSSVLWSVLLAVPLWILLGLNVIWHIQQGKRPIILVISMILCIGFLYISNWSVPRLDSNNLTLQINYHEWEEDDINVFIASSPFRWYVGKGKELIVNLTIVNHLDHEIHLECYVQGAKKHKYTAPIMSPESFSPGNTQVEMDFTVAKEDKNLLLYCGNDFSSASTSID